MEGIIESGQAYKPYKENRKVPPDECHGEIKNITPGLPDQMIVSGHDGQLFNPSQRGLPIEEDMGIRLPSMTFTFTK